MRIILYGESYKKGTGAWCYAETIKSMGHVLEVYDNETYIEKYTTSVFWKVLRRLNGRSILQPDKKKHTDGIKQLAISFLPDIIIILKGIHFSVNDIKELKKHSPFVVNINHDDFFSLNINNRSKSQFRTIAFYDYIFTTRLVNVKEVEEYNKMVDFFMFAYYPPVHFKPVLSEENKVKYAADVLFVGTYEKQRAKMLEELIHAETFDLAIYGNDWHKLNKESVLHKYIRSYEGIWMHDMTNAIAASKITLGFLRKENRDEYTQRSLEIPACGGLLLAERSVFHKKLFEENKEAVFFNADDTKELKNKIKWLLNNPNIAEDIRVSGTKKVIRGKFSYENRINQLIERYNEYHR